MNLTSPTHVGKREARGPDGKMTPSVTPRAYSAFISYNHHDLDVARTLQRRIEDYRVPRALRHSSTNTDPRTGRLKPVFRDRDELTAAADLTEAVRAAIVTSAFLIVVCTPQTPHSTWVGREIALARALHGDEVVLAALFEGDPDTAFHPALTSGSVEGAHRNPLAADFRPDGDGPRLALLKLVAVLAGVRLDALIQRDAHRRFRRLLLAAAGAMVMLAIVAALILQAVLARGETRLEQRRGVAAIAQLVDQREQFSKAGRLDLLKALDRTALDFFRERDVAALPDDVQLLSAKLLQGISEDDETAGDLTGLREAAGAAWQTTRTLLAARPADPDRILAHAQSEYWMGLAAWRISDLGGAKRHFVGYAMLANRLAARDPRRAAWQREAGDAYSNLATFSLRVGEIDQAGRMFRAAQTRFQRAADIGPYDRAIQRDLADGYAWLADVERLNDRLATALDYRLAQRQTLLAMQRRDPDDAGIETRLIKNQLGLARIAALQRRWRDADALFDSGRAAAIARARTDRANADIARQARVFDLFQARAWLDAPARSRPGLDRIASTLGDCAAERAKPDNAEAADLCTIVEARLTALRGAPDRALAILDRTSRGVCRHGLSERWNLDLCQERERARLAIGGSHPGG